MIRKSTFQFLKELRNNNNRDWFLANKSTFNDIQNELIVLTGAFLSEIETFDKSVKGIQPKDCIFRIYKDVRFSKDKSPYKTNLGIFMKGGGKMSPGAGYYFHIEPSNSLLGGGCYEPDSKSLQKIRESILKNPEGLKKIIQTKPFQKEFGSEFYGEKLKTAPKGFAKDHPEIELLKYKSYAVIRNLKDSDLLSKTFFKDSIQSFKLVHTLNQYLDKILFS
jgi:uncharacterized protein (TIGR02453 family)